MSNLECIGIIEDDAALAKKESLFDDFDKLAINYPVQDSFGLLVADYDS